MASNVNKVDVVINFQGKADDIEKTVKNIQTEVNKIKLPQLQTTQVESAFGKVTQKLQAYRDLLDKPIASNKDIQNQAKAAGELEGAYQSLIRTVSKITNLDTDKLLEGFNSKRVKNINDLTSAVQSEIDREKELAGQREELANKTNEIIEKEKELQDLQNKQKYTKNVTKGTLKNAEIERDNIKAKLQAEKESEKYQKAVSYQNRYGLEGTTQKSHYYKTIIQEVDDLAISAQKAEEKVELMQNRLNFDNAQSSITGLKSEKDEIASFISELEQSAVSVDTFKQKLKDLGIEAVNGIDINKVSSYKELITILQSANDSEVNGFLSQINNLNNLMAEGESKINQNTLALERYRDEQGQVEDQTKRLSSEVEQFTQRFTRFFSLYYLGDQFVRAIRNAYSAIKELDAAMTETAVVTDFSVGDMWNQLPEYTKQANELGVATVEAYDAATLYYQQGLDTNTVTQLTTSTLKMARIASLDAATATDRMTNALRGFNMELNETNAERVADVYSKLAAVSATDVNELSVAMTKTASIASSANMEFENTAAFLAQMLETTRESAETAGTALKTVIGRFTEVKKLYSTNQLLGTDEEGEEINVNKVAEALRTAGIDMNQFFTGAKGLDEIFMELAEKWDTLSIVQQRYIATQAAGSRQQSRFIAMLGDYDRLLELQSDAYGANGASQEQYEKTMESLETKLQKLSNAWNQFTMTLMDSDFVKNAIDALTTVLNILNKIISKISGGNGAIAAIEALGIAIASIALIIKANFSLGLEKKLNKLITSILVGSIEKAQAPAMVSSYKAGYTNGLAYAEGFEDAQQKKDLLNDEDLLKKFKSTEKGVESSNKSLLGNASLLLKVAGAIMVVVGALKILKWHNDNFSNEAKYQKAKDQVDLLADAYDSADEKCQQLLDTIDAYADASNKTETLVEGTKEYTKALIEANNQAQELINNYNLVAGKDWIVNADGKIVIDSGAQDRIIKEEQQKVADAQAAKTTATAVEYDEKTLAAIETFSKSVDSFSESDAEFGKVVAAMGTGAAAGAIVGGGAGALVGAGAGLVAGIVDVVKNGTSTKLEESQIKALADAVNESSDTMMAFSAAIGKYETDNDASDLIRVLEAVGITDETMIESLLSNTEELQSLISAVNANTEALKSQQKLAFQEKYADALSNDNIKNSNYITEKYAQYADQNSKDYKETLAAIKDQSNKKIYEQYLKEILGDTTAKGATGENYRVRDRGGTNVTIQQYVDGEWQDVSGKNNNLSKDAMAKELAANKLLNDASTKISQWNAEAERVDQQLKNVGIKGATDSEDNKTYQDKRNAIATSIARGGTADLTSLTREEVAKLQGEVGAITDSKLRDQIKKGIQEYEDVRKSSNIQASSEWGNNYDTMMAERKQSALDTAGMNEQDFAAFAEGLSNQLGLASEQAENLALREIELTNATESLKTIFEENADVLKEGNEALKEGKIAGAAYYSALSKIQEQTEALLGAPLSEEWLQDTENLNKLEEAINGDTEALKELQIEAATQMVISMDLNEQDAQELTDFISYVENNDIQIGASIDDTDFINTLNTMLANGEATAEDVNKYLSSMGYTPDIKMTKISQPTKYSAKLKIAGVEVGNVEGEVNNEISVPQINGKGTTYNGQAKTVTPSSNKSSSKSSSGGSGSTSEWKNQYDWLYNLEQAITEELRKQEKLKADLIDLEADENTSGQQKLDNLREQLKSLERQKQLEELMLNKRKQEMDNLLADNSQYSKYATYNKDTQQVQIDWNAIEAITDEDLYQAVDEYIKKLEEVEKQIDEQNDAIEDIDDQTREILDYYHDDYVEFENRVLDAIVDLKEKEIASIENVSESIDDANSKLIESINSALDKQRQARDNEKQENELTDLEQRIAYLSMDTSGANQVEILNLQKQLDDARQDYTDSLIDQKINELEAQNDKASEERQAQIDIMKAQLDYEQEMGILWTDVSNLINTAFTSTGVPLEGSTLISILKDSEGWKGLSAVQQKDWAGQLKSDMTSTWSFLHTTPLNTSELAGIKQGVDNVADQIGAYKAASTKTSSNGNSGGTSYTGSPDYTYTYDNSSGKETKTNTTPKTVIISAPRAARASDIKEGSKLSDLRLRLTTAAASKGYGTNVAQGNAKGPGLGLSANAVIAKYDAQTSRVKINGLTYKTKSGKYDGPGYSNWIPLSYLQHYASGGINTSTGPAWLDGTKSRPEYVLNADQTQGFLRLIDILDGFRNGSYSNSSVNTQTYGDFNVNIQVDQLANDYDTDKLVKQIKKEIYSDASYRNFNNVTRLR